MAYATITVPEFRATDVSTWFRQLDEQFALAEISSNTTKYIYVCAYLPNDYADLVTNIWNTTSKSNKYDVLKKMFPKRLMEMERKKNQERVEQEVRGDRKPSEFLQHLRSLANNSMTDENLKSVWLKSLPASVQNIIETQDQDLDKLAELADAVFKEIQQTTIREREHDVRSRFRYRSHRPSSHSRNRSPTRNGPDHERRHTMDDKNNSDHCWYHREYGPNATNCRKPCNYEKDK